MIFQVMMAICSFIIGYGVLRIIGAPLKAALPFSIVCGAIDGFVVMPNINEHSTLIFTVCGLVITAAILILMRGARRRRKR